MYTLQMKRRVYIFDVEFRFKPPRYKDLVMEWKRKEDHYVYISYC